MQELEKMLFDYFNKKDNKIISIENAYNLFITFNNEVKRKDTIRFYKEHFKPFLKYCEIIKIKNFNDINNEVLENYYIYLKGLGNSNNTINKRIGLIRNIYHFLLSQGYINKMDLIFKHFEEKEKPITTISESEIIELVKYATTKNLQTKIIIFLLLETGLRRNELVNIKKSNVNLKDNKIFLEITKNKKTRYIFISDYLKELIKNQLKKRTKIYLFETKDNKQLKADYITYMLFMAKKRLKIENLSPHKLRHTYATMMLKNGANIEEIRKLLGHTTYEMTRKYLDYIEEDLKKANEKFNPLAKLIYNKKEV